MWFEKIERLNGMYYIIENHKNKKNTSIGVCEINKRIQTEKTNFQIKLETKFSHWKIAKPIQYLSAYGITKDKANHHQVYFFNENQIRFFAPSLIIINSIFSPPSTTLKYLFDLNGFHDLCHTQMRDGKFSCYFNHKNNHGKCRLNRINWLFAFPTAYNAWQSVYRLSRDGTIGIDLPDADITCQVRGKRIKNSVFITQIRISTVNPTEDAIDWAKMKRGQFSFTLDTGRSRLPDIALIRASGNFRLSNSEWTEIKDFLNTYSDRTPRITRTRIDCILHKLTSGLRWSEIENKYLIQSLYRKLRKNNLWPTIKSILLNHRRKLPVKNKRGECFHIATNTRPGDMREKRA
ncbi:hypothetical protein [Paraburkholderia sp. J10-1]|uniref:hypothetical protein n=1 Tax=Paraburkholderia sp. J10-1 TaxID=2805430 RepID=UPI002AB6E596|nr:hypothetical protein [Paraburkholderia sp. J10-1]